MHSTDACPTTITLTGWDGSSCHFLTQLVSPKLKDSPLRAGLRVRPTLTELHVGTRAWQRR